MDRDTKVSSHRCKGSNNVNLPFFSRGGYKSYIKVVFFITNKCNTAMVCTKYKHTYETTDKRMFKNANSLLNHQNDFPVYISQRQIKKKQSIQDDFSMNYICLKLLSLKRTVIKNIDKKK